MVSFFPISVYPRLSVSDSARFTYISHCPYTRVGRKGDKLLALVVNPFIQADDNVRSVQARLGQLISVADLGKSS